MSGNIGIFNRVRIPGWIKYNGAGSGYRVNTALNILQRDKFGAGLFGSVLFHPASFLIRPEIINHQNPCPGSFRQHIANQLRKVLLEGGKILRILPQLNCHQIQSGIQIRVQKEKL